jgi:DNA replication protein DnaC
LGASINTDWQKEVVLDILDYRYGNELPTIITSNYNSEEIKDIFGARVESRLMASENCILQNWTQDLRKGGY